MQKKKINGVQPFNDFFFKSCYYHQLLAGIACFNVDRDNILLNYFGVVEGGFKLRKQDLYEENELSRLSGFSCKKSNLNKRKLINNINQNKVIIVGVDCFYLESRKDMYQKGHDSHFVLVYGYDLEKRTVNIVDHDYRNSFSYVEKIVSMDNLLYANEEYKTNLTSKKTTCFILSKRRKRSEFSIYDKLNLDLLKSNYRKATDNLLTFKIMVLSDLESLKESLDDMAQYYQDMQNHYFAISRTKAFSEESRQFCVSSLVNGYSNLLSLCWKLRASQDFSYLERKKDSIFRKIDSMLRQEKEILDIFSEVCHERV